MTTLADLHAALLPAATPIGAEDPGTRIAWTRVLRPRVPAFDALDRGDLAIVPLAVLGLVAPGAAGSASVVDACADAGVSGIVVVDGESGDDAGGAALMRAMAERGVAGLRLRRTDVAALERMVIGYLVNERAELERQVAELELRLEAVALDGGGPAGLVATIAGSFGRAVALEGRRGAPIAVHAPADAPATAVAAARYQSAPRDPVALRVRLPGRDVGHPVGSLVLLGERPATELERRAVERVAGLLALELARQEAVRSAEDTARRTEALPSGGPPWVVLLARQRTSAGPGVAPETTDARERREQVRRELRLLAPARRLALRGDADSLDIRLVVAVDAVDPTADAAAFAGRVAAFLGRTVAVSRPFTIRTERPAAEAEARSALELAESVPGPRTVVAAANLPIDRLLGAVHGIRDGERLARSLLEPLLGGRSDVQREHLETLRAILDHGEVSAAAAALGVHRNTVAYRIARIQDLTGWDLVDPDLRLALSVALRVVQTA